MKYICTLLLSLASLIAAEPPCLLSLTVANNQASVTWSHPTAKKFELLCAIPAITNSNRSFSVRPTPGRTNWVFRVETLEDFECAVRAVSTVTDRVTEWSNPIRFVSDGASALPPNPLDPRRWSQSAASTLGTFTSGVGTQDLVMHWAFNKSIEPGFDFKVYESRDLKTWAHVATVPLSTNAGYNIPKQPYAFYKVSVVHQLSGIEHWNAITNLIMDP